MKKLMATISAVVVTALMCVLIAACSNGSFVGTYKFSSMSMSGNGVSMNLKVGEEYMGMSLSEDYVVLEVKEDNTFKMTTAGQEQNGTWKEEDGKYVLTMDGEDQTATLKGNELTLENNEGGMNAKIILKK